MFETKKSGNRKNAHSLEREGISENDNISLDANLESLFVNEFSQHRLLQE